MVGWAGSKSETEQRRELTPPLLGNPIQQPPAPLWSRNPSPGDSHVVNLPDSLSSAKGLDARSVAGSHLKAQRRAWRPGEGVGGTLVPETKLQPSPMATTKWEPDEPHPSPSPLEGCSRHEPPDPIWPRQPG